MDVLKAHRSWVAEQSYEWRRWAVAYVQLKRTIDEFVDGVLDREMLYATIEGIDGALAAMIEVCPETLSVIFAVVEQPDHREVEPPNSEMVKGHWPTA